MLIADVSFTSEGMAVIGALLGALVTALVYIHTQLMKSKDDQLALYKADSEKQLKDEESQKKSYKEIAEEAVMMAEIRINRERERDGKPTIRMIAPIVPEHNSPVTKEQQETANLQTLRARVTAAALMLELPPREPGPPADASSEAVAGAEQLKAAIGMLKQDELKGAIAEVKQDTAELLDKKQKAE